MTHTHTHIYIYIYIYIFPNLISTSIHGTRKKEKKKTPGKRDKSISNHRPGEKEKILLVKKKEKANLVRLLEKKTRDMQSVGQKKTKTCESCNATITRVLNNSKLGGFLVNIRRRFLL